MSELRDLVFHALDNSLENGFADLVLKADVATVAIDLLDYDVGIFELAGDADAMDLVPHIEAWRAARPPAGSRT